MTTFRRTAAEASSAILVDEPSTMHEYYLSPYDQNSVPTLYEEYEWTIRGMIEETRPKTVLHVLLSEREALTPLEIAAILGRSALSIQGVIAALDVRGLISTVYEDGFAKVELRRSTT